MYKIAEDRTSRLTKTSSHLKTLRDLLRYSVSSFEKANLAFGHGNDNAYDEAVYLLLYSLYLPLDTLEPFLDARLLPKEINKVLRLIDRRIHERIPAAYLTKEAWVQSLKFYVDERCIVPRSPIAELLHESLAPWVYDPESITQVLELCTGSAYLAIMAALAFPNAHIDAVDISLDALEVAKRNCNDYKLQDRISLFAGDLYLALDTPAIELNSKKFSIDFLQNKKYDILIANPPYVTNSSMSNLSAEYLAEPAIAMAGGKDGMDVIKPIIYQAKTYMKDTGILIIEVGHEYEYFVKAFPNLIHTCLATKAGAQQILLIHAEDI